MPLESHYDYSRINYPVVSIDGPVNMSCLIDVIMLRISLFLFDFSLTFSNSHCVVY